MPTPEEEAQAKADAESKAKAGDNAGDKPKTFTESDIQKEADRRVSEAQKKWKADLEATIADKTKDAVQQLEALKSKAEEAERYAHFVEAATSAGIKNIKAAYTVAVAHGHLTGGKFATEKFKTENPEFFAPTANANAGNGAGTPNQTTDINDWMRRSVGKG